MYLSQQFEINIESPNKNIAPLVQQLYGAAISILAMLNGFRYFCCVLCYVLTFQNSCVYFVETHFALNANPVRPGLFSRSPGPGGGLRGPDAKNQG